MRVISNKALRVFANAHPDSKSALDNWYKIIKSGSFFNFVELRSVFPSVDRVGTLFIFNIGGNKARLIASIHFNTQIIFIRAILTHADYDMDKWKE